jgi:hypothetical protein
MTALIIILNGGKFALQVVTENGLLSALGYLTAIAVMGILLIIMGLLLVSLIEAGFEGEDSPILKKVEEILPFLKSEW